MRQPFFTWLMTQRNPVAMTDIQNFANAAFYDQSFPKQSDDFGAISRYLEENAPYLHSLTIFDEAWQDYLSSNR